MFPEVLSPLQQEFKSWHGKLSHLQPKFMFILEKLGFLLSIFIDLKDDVPLFPPHVFLTEHRRQQRKKGGKPGSISKDTENKQVATVSVGKIQSYQTGFFPQLSGKLASPRIWAAKLIVDHFSDLTYVNPTRSIIQENNLAGKSYFEKWVATFVVANNGRLAEQPFI